MIWSSLPGDFSSVPKWAKPEKTKLADFFEKNHVYTNKSFHVIFSETELGNTKHKIGPITDVKQNHLYFSICENLESPSCAFAAHTLPEVKMFFFKRMCGSW